MAEEQQGQEKTEDPTARKISKSREEGQVARSRELNSMALVVTGALALLLLLPWGAQRILRLTAKIFELARQPDDYMLEVLKLGVSEMVVTVTPLLLAVLVAGVASTVVMGGFVLSPKALAFKGSRMSPLKGFKRMFSAKSLVELAKSIAKFLLVAGVAVLTLSVLLEDLLTIGFLPLEVAVGEGLTMAGVGLLLIGSSLVLVAVIDVPFQAHEHTKQLKMTKQEVRDEMKDTEGKPEVKSRIRQLQQEMVRRRSLADVPEADVVITNPDHFSVAIKYDSATMAAPLVVAKGADLLAFRIREIAREHDVAVLEVPALARAVYYNAEIGQEVPAGLYVAVAQVLAYLYQLKQFQRGATSAPGPLGEVDVPGEFFVPGTEGAGNE